MKRMASDIIPREFVPVNRRLFAIAIGFGLIVGGAKLAAGADADVATAYGFIHSLQVAVGVWFGAQGWLALSRMERNWLESLNRRVDRILEPMDDLDTAQAESAERRETKPGLPIRLLSGFVGLLPWFLSMSAGSAAVVIVDSRVGVLGTDTAQYILVGAVAATCVAIAAWLSVLIRIEWRVQRAERHWRSLETELTRPDSVIPRRAFLSEATNRATRLVLIVVGVKPLNNLRTTETITLSP